MERGLKGRRGCRHVLRRPSTPGSALLAALLASTTLAAETSWEVGLGTRDSATEPWHAEGARALVRRSWGGLALELDLYATPGTRRDWAREDPWDWDPYVESYVDVDRASVALLADQGLGRRRAEGWWVEPRALAGIEVRRAVRRWPDSLLLTTVAIEPTPTWAGGPDLGLGLQFHAGAHMGARLAAWDRMRWSIEDVWLASDVIAGRRLLVLHDPTATLDVLVAF